MSDQFLRGQEFALGDQVTAQKLMDLVNKATLQVGSVTSQAAITTKTVAADDQIVAYDASADALVKVKAEDILQSNLPVAAVSVTTNAVNGVTGADTVIAPAASQKVSIAGNAAVTGTFTPASINPSTQSFGFSGIKALTIPSGNTANRPTSPVLGDMRWNTETLRSEIYDGTSWKELGTPPFDASGGDVVLAPEATTTAATFSSDGSIVTVTNASGHSVNEGQIVEVISSTAGYTKFEAVAYDITTYTFKLSLKPSILAVVTNISCTYRKSGRHKIHIFKNSGTFVVGNQDAKAEVLIIGGGGGANGWEGGGGGGYALIKDMLINKNQTLSVVVGGAGVSTDSGPASAGGNSSFAGIIAYGGGAGVNASKGGDSGGNNIGLSSVVGLGRNINGACGAGPANFPKSFASIGSGNSEKIISRIFGYLSNITNLDKYYCFGGGGFYGTPSSIHPDNLYSNTTPYNALPNNGCGGYGKSAPVGQPSAGIVIIKYPYWIAL